MRVKKCPDCVSLYLRDVPDDIHDMVLDKQVEEKKKRRNANSKNLEDVIYIIIREHKQLKVNGIVIETDCLKMTVNKRLSVEERRYIDNELNKRMI